MIIFSEALELDSMVEVGYSLPNTEDFWNQHTPIVRVGVPRHAMAL
jgi:hypothetical protein